MAVNTSEFTPSHGTSGNPHAGDAESSTGGSAPNDPEAVIIDVGNPSTAKNSGKAACMLRWDLQIPSVGISIPDVDAVPRPVILKSEIVVQVAEDPTIDGANGTLRLGALRIQLVPWPFDGTAFSVAAYALKTNLPFPTLYDDTIVPGELDSDTFLTSISPILYDSSVMAGDMFHFYEGFTHPSGVLFNEMTDLVSIVQATIDSAAFRPAVTTAIGFVIDAQNLPGDQVAEEFISFISSIAELFVIPPTLRLEWEDGVIVVDAGPDTGAVVGEAQALAGVVTYFSTFTSVWIVDFGPGEVHFADVTDLTSDVTFLAPGVYTLRLTATSDIEPTYSVFDTVVLTVVDPDFHCLTAGSDVVPRIHSNGDVSSRIQANADIRPGARAISDLQARIQAGADVTPRVHASSDICKG